MLLRALPIGALAAAGCSLFVPADEEYVGGVVDGGVSAGTGGSAASAGVAGGGIGGVAASGGASGGNSGSGGTSCESGSSDLVPLVPALYLIVDRTTSMAADGKWTTARQGVLSFMQTSEGGEIALGYFPPIQGAGTCSGSPYDVPVIALAPIAENAPAIKQSLDAAAPLPGQVSQLQGVLTGGAKYAVATAASRTDLQLSLVLLTDWNSINDPCSTDASLLSAITAQASSAEPPVTTHLIGLQASDQNVLHQLADAGQSVAMASALTANQVRTALVRASWPCRFALPANVTGASLTAIATSPIPRQLQQVSGSAACTGDADFYLSGNPPSTLALCPEACLQGSGPVQVQLVVTCDP
jgi:hypothetical protein